MGGLILRSYLAGKTEEHARSLHASRKYRHTKGGIPSRRHTSARALAGQLGTDVQTQEMASGQRQFLFDLNTWNEVSRPSRCWMRFAIAGTGGTGVESRTLSLGVALLTTASPRSTSASLGFLQSGRTRFGFLHATPPSALLDHSGLCSSGAKPIAAIMDANDVTGQIVLSFLTGTSNWQSLGTALEENGLATALGGINLQLQDSTGTPLRSSAAPITSPSRPQRAAAPVRNQQVAFH